MCILYLNKYVFTNIQSGWIWYSYCIVLVVFAFIYEKKVSPDVHCITKVQYSKSSLNATRGSDIKNCKSKVIPIEYYYGLKYIGIH